MKPATHLTIIAVVLLIAGLLAIAGSVLMGFMMMAFSCDAPGTDPQLCILIGGTMGLVVAALFAGPMLSAAYGLWKRRRWARVWALGCGFFLLLYFPFGTAAGAYILYQLWKLDKNDPLFGGAG